METVALLGSVLNPDPPKALTASNLLVHASNSILNRAASGYTDKAASKDSMVSSQVALSTSI